MGCCRLFLLYRDRSLSLDLAMSKLAVTHNMTSFVAGYLDLPKWRSALEIQRWTDKEPRGILHYTTMCGASHLLFTVQIHDTSFCKRVSLFLVMASGALRQRSRRRDRYAVFDDTCLNLKAYSERPLVLAGWRLTSRSQDGPHRAGFLPGSFSCTTLALAS